MSIKNSWKCGLSRLVSGHLILARVERLFPWKQLNLVYKISALGDGGWGDLFYALLGEPVGKLWGEINFSVRVRDSAIIFSSSWPNFPAPPTNIKCHLPLILSSCKWCNTDIHLPFESEVSYNKMISKGMYL